MKHCVSKFLPAAFLAAISFAGTVTAHAQATATGHEYSPSRLDIYAGYGYLRPFASSDIAGYQYPTISNINTTANFTYWFSRHLGVQVEGTYFSDNRTKNPGVATTCATDGFGKVRCEQDEDVLGLMGGFAYRIPLGRWTPYVHVLGGALRANGPVANPLVTGPGFEGGGGVDYTFNFWHQRLAVRPIQADLEGGVLDYGPLVLPAGIVGGNTTLMALKLSGGLVLRFGVEESKRELMLGCTSEPASVYAGDPVTATGSTLNANPRKRLTFTWSASGGRVQPSGATATVDTNGLAPGDYVISGRVSEGAKAREQATCTTAFTVRAPQPPTISCSANPSTITAGGTSDIAAVGASEQRRPLTYSFTASAGQLSGSGSTVHLATVGVAPGTVTVACNVADDLGKTNSASTQVMVIAAPVTAATLPAVASTQTMCSLDFNADRARPARVNNESKACLDDIALTLNRESTDQLVIVGNTSANERPEVAAERALNVRQYMTDEKGIDPSRIEVRVGDTSGRTVNNTIVPAGATFSGANTQTFDEKAITRHGQAYGKPGSTSTPTRRYRRRATAAPVTQ